MAQPTFHDDIRFWESAVSIRKDWLCSYDAFVGTRTRSRIYFRPKSNKSEGEVSAKAAKRIAKYVELLYAAAKRKRIYSKVTKKWYYYKIGFLTLTLQSKQIHSDNEIHEKIFKPFIRFIKSKHPEFLYIYKAETQANGNIHYHLTTNSFIHYMDLRNAWNHYSDMLGYVRNSGIISPNSTDIKAVRSEKDLAVYLSKYLSKNDDTRRKVEIKTWDCSKPLKQCKTSSILSHEQFIELSQSTNVSIIAEMDNCRVIRLNDNLKKQIPETMEIYNSNVIKLREFTNKELSFYTI